MLLIYLYYDSTYKIKNKLMNESFCIGLWYWVAAARCTRRVGGISCSTLAVAESVPESDLGDQLGSVTLDCLVLTFAYVWIQNKKCCQYI